MHKTSINRLLLALCLVFALTAIILGICVVRLRSALREHEALPHVNQFELLSPTVAWLSVDEFMAKQQVLSTSLSDLRPGITAAINATGNQGEYGVYVEDLTTGAWFGINEKDQFTPASLLKIPVMVAVLKKVEAGEIALNQTVVLQPEDIDYYFGPLAYYGPGHTVSVEALLTFMIADSDNTAANALKREFINDEEFISTALAIGLPLPLADRGVSPKQYANSLRALYYSTQLRRPLSQAAISILLKTQFDSQIPAKLPQNIPIAHKIGVAYNDDTKTVGSYHDCGIVYLPQKPYLLCVMSKDSTQAEADTTISEISRVVYEYMRNESNAKSLP